MQFHKILLTGTNGQVGHALQRPLTALGDVVALGRDQLDLSKPDDIRRVVAEIKPDIIINPAAYTAVDKAESEPEIAYAINAEAPRVLAEEAAKLDALLVHYSTDYVYDGTKSQPYVETDGTNPLSVYGKSKLAGEDAIRAVGLPHLILRTSWVYGAYGKNFLKTILRLAAEREELRIVADQFGAPTSSDSIARATIAAIGAYSAEGDSGIYHFTNKGETSWYGFTKAIVEAYQYLGGQPALKVQSAHIRAITTAEYPTLAARPVNSRLDCSKLKHALGVALPSWQDAMQAVLQDVIKKEL